MGRQPLLGLCSRAHTADASLNVQGSDDFSLAENVDFVGVKGPPPITAWSREPPARRRWRWGAPLSRAYAVPTGAGQTRRVTSPRSQLCGPERSAVSPMQSERDDSRTRGTASR